MKVFDQKEPILRSILYGRKAKRHSNKQTKKLRNKSFRMALKQSNTDLSPKDHKQHYGYEF